MNRKKSSEKRMAFTLIELLIVVAIIAILAAIAVPNFLEAQVRSKVSRTKSDMRSLATALEAYFVDENKYPPDYSDVRRGRTQYNELIQRLRHLTTPIAYITTLPNDIFADLVASGGAVRPNGSALDPAPYRKGASSNGEINNPIVYDYAKFDRTPDFPDIVGVWSEITANPENVQWALNSPGPDARVHQFLGFPDLTIYDPTNGTISTGQIIRTNVSAEDNPKQ